MARKKTATSGFGVSRREAHDSSRFYNSPLYESIQSNGQPRAAEGSAQQVRESSQAYVAHPAEWADRIYCQSSDSLPLPDASIGLAFTSPPYNAAKAYSDHDDSLALPEYLAMIRKTAAEVYRVLVPGGRYVVNCAGLGRTPYIPIQAYFHQLHAELGFLPMGEIIWQKGRGASGSCAWGSWKSAKSPRLRDLHEYLLIFAKQSFSRPDKGESDISAEEFMQNTLSIWEVTPESARRVGHPAPFPVELAERVIKTFSYVGDAVLDPFNGSGTTCVAASRLGRRYVGVDISAEYCALAEERLREPAG